MSPIIPSIPASNGRQPGTPTIGTATAGVQSASVAFTAPAYLGKPSTNNIYTATSSPGGITGTSTSTPISVTGLTAGQPYTFTVNLRTRDSANNVIAISGNTNASNSVTPTSPGPFFPFFPPYFPFFPPFFPFFPPFFPFFPPFFPFFPPYFPFFPPFFPFFPPYFPFFPPFFPFFPPFFPPKFAIKCIHSDARILTRTGYVAARDIKVGDKVLTVSSKNISSTPTFHNMSISDNVEFVEVEVTTNIISQKPLIKFNNIDDMFSPNQPIYVKTENGIDWKQTGEVSLGDELVKIDAESGNVTYTTVNSIEHLDAADVHEIRTTPLLWFVVGNYLVVS